MHAASSTGTSTGDARTDRLVVPWGTVLPLAVVATLGSGFWIVSLRGAAGAIERTSEPFAAWLRESVVLLPLYVFAVLAALTLALRWLGYGERRARATLATFVLVVAAATTAGIVVLAVSSAYDYRLEMAHLATMNATHGPCSAECLAVQQQDTLSLQVRAVGLGSLLILVSNLVLLALVIALRGGRLDVASVRPDRVGVGRFSAVESFLVAALLGAAAIHAAVVREHLAGWPAAGMFFGLVCAAQVIVAVMVASRGRPAVMWAAASLSVGTILVWAYSRTIGLPFGPAAGVPEQVGLADVAAAVLETATLVVAVAALRSRWGHGRQSTERKSSQHLALLAVAGVVALTAVGISAGLGLVQATGHTSESTHAATAG